MESLQSLKHRQKGVHNINQITKAMELVAATKMRRSQEIAMASRPYVYAALDFLSNISRIANLPLPELLTPREVKRTALIVITSDKGLAGSFNNAVLRSLEKYMEARKISFGDDSFEFVGIGQKAIAYLEKNGAKHMRSYSRVGDYTTISEVEPIAKDMTDGFLSGSWDKVVSISTHFRTALKQEVLVRETLPATYDQLKKTAEEIIPETGKFKDLVKEHSIPLFQEAELKDAPEYIIEPEPTEVLEDLAKHLIIMEFYHLVLEANASEHAARRVAMKSASDNAKELADKLSIEYNKSRQSVITREIIEITAGAESLK